MRKWIIENISRTSEEEILRPKFRSCCIWYGCWWGLRGFEAYRMPGQARIHLERRVERDREVRNSAKFPVNLDVSKLSFPPRFPRWSCAAEALGRTTCIFWATLTETSPNHDAKSFECVCGRSLEPTGRRNRMPLSL